MFSDCISDFPLRLSLFNRLPALVLVSFCAVVPARAQCSFSSGSTGADGAFNPTTSQTVQLPESGVFNFTTINIPRGVTIKFARNSKNTPVRILTSGNVAIAGTIDINGGPGSTSIFGAAATSGVGVGGPGGFDGGRGGFSFAPFFPGAPGDGPGGGGNGTGVGSVLQGGGGSFGAAGGQSNGGQGGQKYGTRTLVPLIGGSGGGGNSASSGINGFGGGGGGGGILLASSGTITFGDAQGGGSILANGGAGGSATSFFPGSGGGAGGAIKLAAATITGRITLQVQGGAPFSGNAGGHGYIRVEACNYNSFEPTTAPAVTSTSEPTISLAPPSTLSLPNAPTLKVTSVAGIAAPAMPAGSFHATPDIIVPTAQTNPVSVALQASNIPLGTVVTVAVAAEAGSIVTVQSTPLAGALANSNATANVNLPASGSSLISAQLSFTPAGMSFNRSPLLPLLPLLIDGERIQRVEVAARFGGQSEVTYITESGKRIKRAGE